MNISQALEKARCVIRRQHKALSTEETYLFWLRRYIGALQAMPKELSSEKKFEQFLTDLAPAGAGTIRLRAGLFYRQCRVPKRHLTI